FAPEVLYDDFLNVTVALVEIADGQQTVGALFLRLADADQDPGGERDFQLAGVRDRTQADDRVLVRRRVMRAAASSQARADVLQHQTHADVHGPQQLELRDRQYTGVGVRPDLLLE